MTMPPDYSLVDQTPFASSMFVPRPVWRPPPEGATDIAVPVDEGIALVARFYRHHAVAPTILFFHGNGEVAVEYDSLAHLYRQAGVNLIVVDYRGYGASGGHSSFATMLRDAHTVLRAVRAGLAGEGFSGSLFTMGRSLGVQAAAEIAAQYPDQLAGLIVESGAASVARMVASLTQMGQAAAADELARRHEAKLRSIRIPVLMLHGEQDDLIPLDTALGFYELLESHDKRLVIIPAAGHNNILLVGMRQYFTALQEFIQAHG